MTRAVGAGAAEVAADGLASDDAVRAPSAASPGLRRATADAFRLLWPFPGAWRLLVPGAIDRAWPVLRRAAGVHRRTVIRRVRLVAVVGSLGKTTTRSMVAAALGPEVPRQSASNHAVRLAADVLRLRPWHRHAVLEAGISRPGQMRRLAAMLRPDVVVVTSIRSDHARSFPTFEHTRDEKAEMVRALRADGLAVLNADDPHVLWMSTQTAARVTTFGFADGADVRATDVVVEGAAGTRFTLHAGGASRAVRLRLIGAHLVPAALAAVAVGLARDVPLGDLVRRIESVPPVAQRMQTVVLADGVTVLDDTFKGTAESTVAAVAAFRDFPASRRLVVLGPVTEPPRPQRAYYRDLGTRLAPWADRVIVLGSRHVGLVATGAAAAGVPRDACTGRVAGVHDAVAILRRELRPGDAVLVKADQTLRPERIVLALQGRTVRCAVRACTVRAFVRCAACPLLEREEAAFDNVHLRGFFVR